MIHCLLTATPSSLSLLNSDESTALQLLTESLAGAETVELVTDPEAADLILFAESHRNDDAIRHVLRHPLYLGHREKCTVHCGMDYPEPLIPGVYPSISRRWAERLCCAGGPYLAPLNPHVGAAEIANTPVDLLASFMGACENKPVRQKLLNAAAAPGWHDILVEDTGAAFVRSVQGGDMETHTSLKRRFAEKMAQSRYVLCPAGEGPSTLRLFEAMKASRVPVVIADEWTPPPGPDWDAFLLRIPEADIALTPEILRRQADDWEEKGQIARGAWERYCDHESFGPHIVETAAAVLAEARTRPLRRRVHAWIYVNGPRRAKLLWKLLAGKITRRLTR